MKISSSMSSYPVFPDWVFEGELPIDDNIVNSVLSEIQLHKETNNVQNANFGWISNKHVLLGNNTIKLNSLIGNMFVNNVTPHFRLSKELTNRVQICESWFLGIKPTYNFPHDIHRHRWYHSVLFLKANKQSSNLFFDQHGTKLYSSPPGVQPYEHVIKSNQNKIVFFPAHLPWGFTPNHSSSDTIIFCNSFIIKQ